MASPLLQRFSHAIRRLESTLALMFKGPPPGELALAGFESVSVPKGAPFSLKDLVGDGFLWGVPTARRTIERRLKRKFGDPKYILKILQPKTTIRTCNTCGDDHIMGVLCPTCYKTVIEETKQMQEAIQNELKLDPVENEVVVLYQGEKDGKPNEYWQGKRIVELPKQRPALFSRNLLERTTQQPATTADVKPSDLG